MLATFSRNLRHFSTKYAKRAVQVCVLGADTPAGQMTAFLLKQNPYVSILHLQGTSRVESLGVDLSHFDTKCQVRTHFDSDSAAKSMKSADVVVMMGVNTNSSKMSLARLVMSEGKRLVQLAQTCARYAPKSIILVSVAPVSVTLPIVEQVFRQSDWYHPGRLLGSCGIAQIKANAISGHFQNFDPQMVHVPVVGGPDLDCALPLFSQTSPVGMSSRDASKLFERFKVEEPVNPSISQAVGINRTIAAVAKGIIGVDGGHTSAFVRSNIIKTCRHLVASVAIGKHGIYHNYGLPKLAKNELVSFEEIALELAKREAMAVDLVAHHDSCNLPTFMSKEIHEEKVFSEGVIR